MHFDFRPPRRAMARRGHWHRLPLLLLALVLAAALALVCRESVSPSEARTAPVERTPAPPAPPEVRRKVVDGTIRPGDTVSALLGGYLTSQQLHDLATRSRPLFPLSDICAGQPYKLCLADGALERFEYEIGPEARLVIQRQEDGFDINRVAIPCTVRTELVQGAISSSLFEAVSEAGETDALAVTLADIFAWDIDFIRDLRGGDTFRALVEKRTREDGVAAGYGRVLAAEFVNQGQSYKAFLFQDGDRRPDYYDAAGNSLRKAFLKAPLAFSRISSGFTMKRFHPITKTWKAHPAIDYAAPTGTPIKAIGDGTVTRIGFTAGNGNFIKLRHPNGLESLYLHMSRFTKGMKQGRKVGQGEVIGYVGSTGLATGPHLCFRMYKNGAPINPNKVQMAAAAPVSRERMAEFKTAAAPLLARLQGREMPQVAAAPR